MRNREREIFPEKAKRMIGMKNEKGSIGSSFSHGKFGRKLLPTYLRYIYIEKYQTHTFGFLSLLSFPLFRKYLSLFYFFHYFFPFLSPTPQITFLIFSAIKHYIEFLAKFFLFSTKLLVIYRPAFPVNKILVIEFSCNSYFIMHIQKNQDGN